MIGVTAIRVWRMRVWKKKWRMVERRNFRESGDRKR
jgi:hypothetical protein